MNTGQFSPERSAAIRSELVRAVESTTRSRLKRSRRWVSLVAFVAAGIVAGGAVSAAASANILWPQAQESNQGLPGSPVVTALTGAVSMEGAGNRQINLPPAPKTATDLSVVFTCLSAGNFIWGTDPVNNPGSSCSEEDSTGHTASASYDFPITPQITKFYIAASADARWSLVTRFIHKASTAWGTNQSGQTYGVAKANGAEPDLIAVIGKDDAGKEVEGYAKKTDLEGPMPTSPAQALQMQADEQARYPNGHPIPVYRSDGTTRIGTFTVGGN